MVQNVTGSFRRSPPRRRMSCSSVAWMTDPDPRKSSALKNACVPRLKIPPTRAPGPPPRAPPRAPHVLLLGGVDARPRPQEEQRLEERMRPQVEDRGDGRADA